MSTATQSKSDPARWQRLKNILADALEQTSAEKQTATLREACADDAALLREAEQLLAQDTSVLEEFAEFAATRLRRDEGDRAGERLGAYVIVRELGRGGMGAVYLAERADGQFQKRVAVKVLKRGTDTEEVLRRFRRGHHGGRLTVLRNGVRRRNAHYPVGSAPKGRATGST